MAHHIRTTLISAGVKNLRAFGYPAASEDNILTDLIYSRFFDNMLEQNLGQGVDAEIKALRDEIRQAQSSADPA